MRVYQVLAPASFGGAETVCLSLSAALGAIGVQCTVVMLVTSDAPDALLARAERLGLSVVVLRNGRRGYHRDVRAIRTLIARDESAVLHAHLARANLAARCAAALARSACVATLHGHSDGSMRRRLYNLADLSVLRTMDAVFTVSHTALTEMRELSPRSADRFIAVPSALLPEPGVTRAGAREELGVPADATVIGWVGRLAVEKRPELFVRSVAEVAHRESLPDPWHAVMVGDGPLLSATRGLADALGVADRITFSGFQADAGRLVSAFDVVAMTSRSEELPTVLLECLHGGVPVASTAVGDVPRIAERCGAVRVSEATPAGLARSLTALLAASASGSDVAGFGRTYIAEHHAPAVWAERHRELYTLALARRHAGAR